MNISPNVSFSWKERIIQQKKPEKVLFSGFLAAFLGATGIQAGMPASFETVKSTLPKESVTIVVCEEHPGVNAIIADSGLQTVTQEASQSEKTSEECQHQKKIEETLEAEIVLPEEEQGKLSQAEQEKEALHRKKVAALEALLKGHPLAQMSESIAKQDPEIAALIVGIARKESQWGLRSPKKNGDCFNYWGYKGAGDRGTGMGYACFATREEAVEKIAKRLEKLVDKRGTSKPSALVTPWKCGNSCATHSPESVQKWVSDVNQYYTKVLAMK